MAQKGPQNQVIGRSRDKLTAKIAALMDALGNLVRFVLLPGQRHNTVGVAPLISGLVFDALLGERPLTSIRFAPNSMPAAPSQ